jgi:tartrate-resistant acid phosphatase type 5
MSFFVQFYEDGVTGIHDDMWDSAFHSVYAAPSLNVPWYGVLGNHDYHGDISAQIDRTVVSGETMWYMPSTYYSVDYSVPGGGVMTIVYIDTCLLDPYAKDTEDVLSNPHWVDERTDHLDWIDSTLAAASARSNWLVVAGHYPIYSMGEHGDDSYLVNDLLPILKEHNVHVYMAGHDHNHQHIFKDGLHHIISGNSAGRGPFGEGGYQNLGISAATDQVMHYHLACGFTVASVTARNLTFTFIDNHGVVKYATTLDQPLNTDVLRLGEALEAIAMAPRLIGMFIIIPMTTIALSLILFLSKDFLWPPPPAPGFNSHSIARLQELKKYQQQQGGEQRGEDSEMDSSSWSRLDVSTDRLKPSRHGP